ncbi:50S ribosomal protein L21, chloroplastic [Phalaenopsis equestris]|uniref:50S ribosomal protein L21, chloroplastic n=1 Tax=Phalaenopsis equestris TaxID=78828 RepID=UPI0009E51847|nr:50S ribosomal protein L21, chloroplastic [Phalaenopsis equestris]
MAFSLGSLTAFNTLSSTARIHKPALYREPQQRASRFFSSNRSSSPCSSAFLSLRPLFSPSPLRSPRWNPAAAESEDAPQAESPAPEPVETQIEAAAASSTRKGEDVFAVVMIGSRQYIVIPGRFIYTQRLKGANVNDKVILSKVLLVGTPNKAYIGQPVVTNAVVHAVVEEQGLDKKVIVFKYKKKKNYRRNIGHRQPNTRIRIIGISGYEAYPADTLPEPESVAA